uniref:Uncharacterized protein n=1 Tax=Acrobeloides nanus TaxID=290746 RepID=A0A914CKV3_9BILA
MDANVNRGIDYSQLQQATRKKQKNYNVIPALTRIGKRELPKDILMNDAFLLEKRRLNLNQRMFLLLLRYDDDSLKIPKQKRSILTSSALKKSGTKTRRMCTKCVLLFSYKNSI